MNSNRKKLKEMQQKSWWNYALLAAGIFVFTQGSSILARSPEYAVPAVFFSLFMHSSALSGLSKKFFKAEPSKAVTTAMLAALIVLAAVSYLKEISLLLILMLNIAAAILYLTIAALQNGLNRQ